MDEGFGGDLQQPTISEAQRFRLRLRLHGVAHNAPSPMAGLRSALSLPVGGHLCVGVF